MSELRKTDPRLADVLQATAARVIRYAGPTCKVAYAAKRDESTVRHWGGGVASNIVNRIAEFLERLVRIGGNPELVLAFLESVVLRARFKGLSDDEVLRLWWQTHPEEARLEGIENQRWAEYPVTGDLDAGIEADLKELSIQKLRLACSLECQRRGLDPSKAVIS